MTIGDGGMALGGETEELSNYIEFNGGSNQNTKKIPYIQFHVTDKNNSTTYLGLPYTPIVSFIYKSFNKDGIIYKYLFDSTPTISTNTANFYKYDTIELSFDNIFNLFNVSTIFTKYKAKFDITSGDNNTYRVGLNYSTSVNIPNTMIINGNVNNGVLDFTTNISSIRTSLISTLKSTYIYPIGIGTTQYVRLNLIELILE
jgi:hypothetical protein